MSESCNGTPTFDRGRGTATYGTKGTLVLDRDGYVVFDLKGKVVKQNIEPKRGNGLDLVGDDAATLSAHGELRRRRFAPAKRFARPSPTASRRTCSATSATSRSSPAARCKIDPANGHIVGDAEAMKLWSRTYEPGWAPAV